jgi:hypothetical protein
MALSRHLDRLLDSELRAPGEVSRNQDPVKTLHESRRLAVHAMGMIMENYVFGRTTADSIDN